MAKKLFVLLLSLICLLVFSGCCSHEWYAATCEAPKTCAKCSETEGEALGHSWVDASCETPKSCTVCSAIEGAALGHSWLDATTEAPKTCSVCSLTEGERIITDERFTTASTKELYGKWITIYDTPSEDFGLDGFEGALSMEITFEFHNDGTMKTNYVVLNEEEFSAVMVDYLIRTVYSSFPNLTEEAIDAALVAQLGMTVREYAESSVAAADFAGTFESMGSTYVYYADGSQIYHGANWRADLVVSDFTLDGDTLSIAGALSITDDATTFTRAE